MLVGVERQADRGDAGDAVAFEHAHQLALGRPEARDDGLEFLVLALLLADRGESAAQIVGARQYVAREFVRRIGVRVGPLLVLAARSAVRSVGNVCFSPSGIGSIASRDVKKQL